MGDKVENKPLKIDKSTILDYVSSVALKTPVGSVKKLTNTEGFTSEFKYVYKFIMVVLVFYIITKTKWFQEL